MSNEAKNLSKLLHFTESLCAFADDVAEYEYHDCLFNVEIDDDKFQFDLPELVAEIRKYHQAVIDDTENCSDTERSNEVADKPKSVFAEPFVPEFPTKKTSSDEITISDFDYFRKDMSDTLQNLLDLLLLSLIIEEAKGHEKLPEPKSKDERIKEIGMYAMLRLAQIAVG